MNGELSKLIRKGGVYRDEQGDTPEQIYKSVCSKLKLPDYLTKDAVYEALCARERLMSTAVGNGIALPHARNAVLRTAEDEQVAVVYLKEPLQMNSPDEKKSICHVHYIFLHLAGASDDSFMACAGV